MAELIKTTDSLNDGRKKLNDAITDSNAALSTANTAKQTANLAKAESESTQTQLDTIVIEGDSSVEAAQARVNNSGTAFPTLKQRLDAEHQEVTAQLQQKPESWEVFLIQSGININDFDESTRQTFLEAQGIDVNYILGEGNVKRINIADGSVSPTETNFFKQTQNLFDKSKVTLETALQVSTGNVLSISDFNTYRLDVSSGQQYTIKDGAGASALGHGYFRSDGSYISGDAHSSIGPMTVTIPPETSYAIFTVNTSRMDKQQIELGAESTPLVPNRVLVEQYLNVNTDSVVEKAITTTKRTILGEQAYLAISNDYFNIDTSSKKVILPAVDKYIFYRNRSVNLGNEEIVIDLSNGLLGYNLTDNSFKMGVTTLFGENDVILGYYYPNNHHFNGRYTVNDIAPFKNGIITKDMLSFNPITEIPTLTIESKWKGANAVAFADSIGWYDGRPFGASHRESGQIAVSYLSHMREQLQCTVDNQGYSGQDLTQISDIIEGYDFTNIDFVTITSGANDERKGIPVGTLAEIGTTFDDTTYIGAYQKAIESILDKKNTIKIYLMTPIRGWYNEYDTSDVPNTDPNVVGMMSEKYADATKAVAELYGLPVHDWYNCTGLNEINKNTFLGDGLSLPYYLHPTNLFYERMSSSLIPFINNN